MVCHDGRLNLMGDDPRPDRYISWLLLKSTERVESGYRLREPRHQEQSVLQLEGTEATI